jgi:hypothetical protein
MEAWGGLEAEQQLLGLRSVIEATSLSLEMDTCLEGELILRAKDLNAAEAVLDLQPPLPASAEVLSRLAPSAPDFTLYVIPDYSRAIGGRARGRYDYDAYIYGAFQARVLEFLDEKDVSTIILPASLHHQIPREVAAPAPRAERVRAITTAIQEHFRLSTPTPDFTSLFPGGGLDGEPSVEQLLVLGRYGAHLVRYLGREDVALELDFDRDLLRSLTESAEAGGASSSPLAVALMAEVYHPGQPRMPDFPGDPAEGPGYALQEVRWPGIRPYLQWRTSTIGLSTVVDRINFDYVDLSNYFARKTSGEPISDPKATVRRELLFQSFVSALRKAPSIPIVLARELPRFDEVMGSSALEVFLDRQADYLSFEGEFEGGPEGVRDAKSWILHWAEAKQYPGELLERIRAMPLEQRWKPSSEGDLSRSRR